MELVLAVIVLALVVAFVVVGPLRRGAESDRREDDRHAELEAAKEAKYREIRDADLDLQMGKLSEADHRAIDRELRAQAIEILRQIDELEGREGDERPPAAAAGR
jgi:type II secretory pathway component PulM